MAGQASWEETITVSRQFLNELRSFIHEPGGRQQDVFWRREVDVDKPRQIQLIIKHDLFEGVVLTLNLMDTEEYRFLGGDVRALAVAEDILGDIEVARDGAIYRVTFSRGAEDAS